MGNSKESKPKDPIGKNVEGFQRDKSKFVKIDVFGSKAKKHEMEKDIWQRFFPKEETWFAGASTRKEREEIVKKWPAMEGFPDVVPSKPASKKDRPEQRNRETELRVLQLVILEASFPLQHLLNWMVENVSDRAKEWGPILRDHNQLIHTANGMMSLFRVRNMLRFKVAKRLEDQEKMQN